MCPSPDRSVPEEVLCPIALEAALFADGTHGGDDGVLAEIEGDQLTWTSKEQQVRGLVDNILDSGGFYPDGCEEDRSASLRDSKVAGRSGSGGHRANTVAIPQSVRRPRQQIQGLHAPFGTYGKADHPRQTERVCAVFRRFSASESPTARPAGGLSATQVLGGIQFGE